MSDKKTENRTNIEDLPQAEKELSPEEAKEVKGGAGMLLPAIQKATETTSSNMYNSDKLTDHITGAGAGGGPHVKK